ncbi:MAG: zinc ABC transporter substrate-binding protein [Anaerolineaceae bacterium]|nr:zinc ABC transporter substrate-binding protein [Anaerolineaceae bacterium]
MKTKGIFLFVVLVVVLLFTACQSTVEQGPTGDERMVVFVSVVPQQYFVDRIGGEFVDVRVMVEAGDSPATYEPKPSQMAALSEAKIYYSIGVPFETVWLEKITSMNKSMVIVDTASGIERLPIMDEHSHENDEKETDHKEGALDPHIWLSPSLVKIQARHIFSALVEADSEHAKEYESNLNAFLSDIESLEEELTQTLSDLETRKFMVFHPSWGYFARDFDLEQIAIEVGGTEPSAEEMVELIEKAQKEDIHVIFAQPEFSQQDAETIANAIGGEVVLISPLAYDWLENLREVAATFSSALGAKK